MAREKSSSGPGPAVLGPLFRAVCFGPGGRFAPLWVTAAVVAAGGYWAWAKFGGEIRSGPHYHVTSDAIAVTPQPAWIKADVKTEALRDASIDLPVSILDEQLAERLTKAFAFHPWVAVVQEVRKSPPANVEIDLVYRKPACMVELPDRSGLYAVDADGVLLPSRDFLDDPKSTARFPRLGGVTSINVGRVGAPWNDPRVIGGARIAAALENDWARLNFARIAPSDHSGPHGAGTHFEIATRNGTIVLWGSSPGSETDGEMSAEQKIAALGRYVADHGSLEGRDGPQRLDLRGKAITVLANESPTGDTETSAAKPKADERR